MTIKAYFDITIDDKPAGRILFNLFDDVTPKTAENFRALATGEGLRLRGLRVPPRDPAVHAAGWRLHRRQRHRGKSIYGEKFADENFTLKHSKPGLLSMANAGPNTNGSQFFVTTVVTPWLDGKHVVFGEVADDASMELVRKIESLGSQSGTTKAKIAISASGTL
ncbi:peptidylprolyl isomerase [Streptomyces sp. M10(2022)]